MKWLFEVLKEFLRKLNLDSNFSTIYSLLEFIQNLHYPPRFRWTEKSVLSASEANFICRDTRFNLLGETEAGLINLLEAARSH